MRLILMTMASYTIQSIQKSKVSVKNQTRKYIGGAFAALYDRDKTLGKLRESALVSPRLIHRPSITYLGVTSVKARKLFLSNCKVLSAASVVKTIIFREIIAHTHTFEYN